MPRFLSYLLVLIFTGAFASATLAQTKKIAILPTVTNIRKDALRAGIDSVSWAQIQEKEGLSNQSKNYYLIAQKNPKYDLAFQPFGQTNALLQEAGIPFNRLLDVDQRELAAILGVDLLFYGINYRVPDANTPEERLAINTGLSILLGPVIASAARTSDKPITTLHYLLYDRATNQAIWHYQNETARPSDLYADKCRRFLMQRYPAKR